MVKRTSRKRSQPSLYEKKIVAQLDASLGDLREGVPQEPKWGIKKNSDGKNVFWYGFKGHLLSALPVNIFYNHSFHPVT